MKVADYLRIENKLLCVRKAGEKRDANRSVWCKGLGVVGTSGRRGCKGRVRRRPNGHSWIRERTWA